MRWGDVVFDVVENRPFMLAMRDDLIERASWVFAVRLTLHSERALRKDAPRSADLARIPLGETPVAYPDPTSWNHYPQGHHRRLSLVQTTSLRSFARKDLHGEGRFKPNGTIPARYAEIVRAELRATFVGFEPLPQKLPYKIPGWTSTVKQGEIVRAEFQPPGRPPAAGTWVICSHNAVHKGCSVSNVVLLPIRDSESNGIVSKYDFEALRTWNAFFDKNVKFQVVGKVSEEEMTTIVHVITNVLGVDNASV